MTKTKTILQRLRRFESRNVTYQDPAGDWPIMWNKAKGVYVWDEEGKRYLDLTAAFGVAAAGHANTKVIRAGQRQLARMPHAMGDVHPHALKAELAQTLSGLTFERWSRASQSAKRRSATEGKTIFCNSGFEAVEAALKTARLYTGRREILSFQGGYHGLGYGSLNATHRRLFVSPFANQLGKFGRFVPFPETEEQVTATMAKVHSSLQSRKVGAILVEPIQGRGGCRVAMDSLLHRLREVCDATRTLLVLDEIYTGFGRTGRWFACEHSGVIPDLICLGKAMTGGFPLSACVGRAAIMDQAWPESDGEAIHTSTFLGNPTGCAMALAQIHEIRQQRLPQRAARLGKKLERWLNELDLAQVGLQTKVRGCGLMAGLEVNDTQGRPAKRIVIQAVKRLLKDGFIFLPSGEHSNVLSWTPPLIIPENKLKESVIKSEQALTKCAHQYPS